ncbi:uncharacterized protein EDB93DRAFT_1263240 [Suillus bovinus]|uniref:uncharacterized protein n=1 Tax=Suillus bovinus TaxID=48563 RepID=UPI001B85CA5A|nr:uncharacterized protein EDB93DRAFT_1263240 [Suillus bovinus]KAG2130797.1 hypothetical protein EDB93DRAFT_1263240 [Suillus bovinus]
MEYSTGNIAAATNSQFTKYIYISMTTLWIYDYWTFLFRSHWAKMKGLYIVTRYLPFILLAMDLCLSFAPNETPGLRQKCRVLANIKSGLSIVVVIFSECIYRSPILCFFILRTILLAVMLFTFIIFMGASSGIAFATTAPASYATSAIPGITGCYESSTSFWLFIPFLLLSVFELGLMILTLISAIQNWQENQSHLYAILVNHNVSYYACGLLTNVFTSLLLQSSYHAMLYEYAYPYHVVYSH